LLDTIDSFADELEVTGKHLLDTIDSFAEELEATGEHE
jgi:hypothetical protein